MGDFNFNRGFWHFFAFGPSAETGSCITTFGQMIFIAALAILVLSALASFF